MAVRTLHRPIAALLPAVITGLLVAQPNPSSWPGIALPGGERFEFRLHFPDGVTPETPCPVALVFVDGKQGRGEVWDTLAHYFWMQAPRERIGVVLPVAPEAGPFHVSGLAGVRYFVRSLRGKTRVAGNGLHVIGIGTGAASAFAFVQTWPHQAASITVAITAGQELPQDLPADPRYQHLRLVVVTPGADGVPPQPWQERIANWTQRGWRAEWRDCAQPGPDAILDALRAVTKTAESPPAEQPIHECLDRWHSAAARTDEATYWRLWHEEGVFLPPGSVERWSVAQLRERAAPEFARAPGWTLIPVQRWIRVAEDGKSAWVEESLGCFPHGAGRGLGLLTRSDDGWRILRYAVTGFPQGAIPGEDW